jgi:AcrR family transcriptional regulator
MITRVVQRARLSSEERKASIVDAACRLFSEKGFRGTTTRELAAMVGVTEPVLYEHFRTKRELYSAIIESKASEGFQVISAIRERFRDSPDDSAFFTLLAETIVDWYTTDPSFIRLLLFSSLEGHELKSLFHERSRDCFELVSGYIERRIQDGAFRHVDPELAARAFFGMVAQYAQTAIVFGICAFPRPAKEVVRDMVSIFLGGLCKQDNKQ